jgi:hypothetical protein
MFFWIHMIFSMICRSLIRTFFANHIRTHITDSYVGSTFYTNSYCLLTTYKLIYYGREILRIRILPCTTRIWPCNTTNSYVFNYTNSILQTRMWLTKKISDKKNIQTHMKQHLHTEWKNSKYKKRGSPLSPGMRKSVHLPRKYFRHQPKKVDCRNFFI